MNTSTEISTITEGTVSWRAPSNIALVKYWGKYGNQLPSNSSLSFTLSKCYTHTTLKWEARPEKSSFELDFLFEGQKNAKFQKRTEDFLLSLASTEMPFLNSLNIRIETDNSFPHSTGIASSASAMAALALCLCEIESKIYPMPLDKFKQRASYIARLGSGSASRSVVEAVAFWGEHSAFDNSSQEYAIKLENISDYFQNFCDTVLIVDSGEKSVSSSVGHSLMRDHPMAQIRFQNANENCKKLSQIMQGHDFMGFAEIVEKEALELHALMMTSDPSFVLMRPNTLAIIEKVRAYRKETGSSICFTLDAGPNVHLLYPKGEQEKIMNFIREELLEHCESEHYIEDFVGKGPVKLNE